MNMNENRDNSELNQSSVTPSDTDNTLNPVIDNNINTESSNGQDIVSPTDSETSPKSKKIPLTIRCPFTTQDLNIHIDPDSNVLHLKRKICKEFPSNPKPSDQRLIFGGRIIQNNEILSEVLKRQLCDLSTPPIIHLIINSLAIQHAQTVKRPVSRTNSDNLSSNNTPSTSIQNSPSESKQSLNDIKSPSNLSLSSDDNKEKKVETPVESKPSTSSTSNVSPVVSNDPYTSTEDIPVRIDPPDNNIQYVLINNIIYAVQVAPSFSIPMYIEQSTAQNESDNSTARAENNTNNDNNNNNGNNNDAAQPAANAENVQQEVIIGNDDPQRQQPNQFFLLVRLAFIVYILTQGGGYIRLIIVTLVAIIIFLVQTGRLTVTVIRNNNILNEQANNNNDNNNNREVNNNNQADNNNNNNNENDPLLNNNNNDNNNNENNDPNNNNNNNNNNNPENAVQQYSFLTNCRRIFFAFFLSLIPFIQDVA
ncbi:hypothetical protein BCR32DRAFT_264683 [Anaeromyces robustus]|uniref:Ubiquitin-like domain-containing protein n=1 Tax=Anaeromyces robustus TaxID=1754192 RepID=A0A1Y1XME2_9FUNG|nr:hypothetical protein BCR32DRAFT_264683 [Anaeromyces robustus]|eukprot:ORX86930.1 hypothetical protein BCR32DRAFT_264683 [Anaeromyces robustus]